MSDQTHRLLIEVYTVFGQCAADDDTTVEMLRLQLHGHPGAAAAPAAAAPGGGPPPFATVIKDARRVDGVITAWHKDERLWLELLSPEQLGKPFRFTPKVRQGIGEGWLSGGLMTYPVSGAGGMQVVEFARVYNTVRLVARNTDVVVRDAAPESRGCARPTPRACSA